MDSDQTILQMASKIIAAYVANHKVEINDIQNISQTIFKAVKGLIPGSHNYKVIGPLVPAIAIEDSVTDDYIVCLEDGKRLKMLKRHISTEYNMTVDQYRERWNLGPDYPVVAPNYAKRRSQIARDTGLGTGRRKRSNEN